MSTFIALAIYIIGVWVAYFQVQQWRLDRVIEKDECQILFMLSMLSWAVYPLHGIAWLIHKAGEDKK